MVFRPCLSLPPMALIWLAVACGPKANYPPSLLVAPSGPLTGQTNTQYYFAATAYDGENDSVKYQFYWGDGTSSSWTRFHPSGIGDSVAKSWANPAPYSVRARAADPHGSVSDSSEPHAITIYPRPANSTPNRPAAPAGPTQGWRDSAYSFTAATTDPDNDSIAYQFEWDDGSAAQWSGYLPSGSAVTDTHSWSVADTCNVMVRARDNKGLVSDWSPPHAIVIADSTKRGNHR
jgi:hypothetical protein